VGAGTDNATGPALKARVDYLIVKWLHVLSATVLFGTGIGTAYYMLCASLSGRSLATAVVMGHGVRADWLFTGISGIVQPLTGLYLVHRLGLPLQTRWVVWALLLYGVALACWLPVVWLQIRMRHIAEQAAAGGAALPPAYFRCLRIWIVLGVPAFVALVVVFWLMVAKPV
jgi:uncharacterized membrane protein